MKNKETEFLTEGEDYERMANSLLEKMGEVTDDMKLELGWSLLDCGEYKAGLALYSSLSWSTYGEAKCCGMGRALTEMGHYEEARKILQKGLQRFSKSCALWVAMGGLNDALGNHSESLKCFEIALQFAHGKDYENICYNKAVVLMKMGCYCDAASIIEYLIEECPEDPKYLAERGYCSLDMGYPYEAVQYFQKGMELYERFPTIDAGVSIYTGLCSSYMDLGMKKEAVEIALEGIKKFPDEDPILYHNAGATFLEMGWRQEAIEILKRGIEIFSDDQELKMFLKEIEEDFDNDPLHGGELLSLILLTAVIYKKLKKK